MKRARSRSAPRARVPAATLVRMAGGNAALAKLLADRGDPITSQAISYWIRIDRIPSDYAGIISHITQIPLYRIRPDRFPEPADAA